MNEVIEAVRKWIDESPAGCLRDCWIEMTKHGMMIRPRQRDIQGGKIIVNDVVLHWVDVDKNLDPLYAQMRVKEAMDAIANPKKGKKK